MGKDNTDLEGKKKDEIVEQEIKEIEEEEHITPENNQEEEEPQVVIEEDKEEEKELSEEQRSKRDDRTFYIIIAAIAIIFVGFFAVTYYVNTHRAPTSDVESKVTYNKFDFYLIEGFWNFQWQRGDNLYHVELRFNPYEAEKVPVYIKRPFNNFSTEKVYLTFDPLGNNTPHMTLATGELGLSAKKVFNITPEGACTRNETEVCQLVPIINCSNTNQSVILIQEINETMVIVDGNCLIIQGSQMELLRAVDRVLYEWYGIITPKPTEE